MLLLMAVLSGCGKDISGQFSKTSAQTQNGETEPAASEPGAKGEEGANPGKSGMPEGGEPALYHMDEIYTKEENILPVTESAAAEGISYKIQNVEYTDSFGDRDPERLQIFSPEVKTDGQGNLQGDFKYLFLTVTFTNTGEQTQEIYRTSNGISVIGASLNTVAWTSDACYYDKDWEKGTESQKHHWVLEPGESVTSEVGWVIEGCGSVLAADEELETRMGSKGPYTLYYRVGLFDGNNEGCSFIDLGVKVE